MSVNAQQLRAVREPAVAPGGRLARGGGAMAALRRLRERLVRARKRRIAINDLSRLDDRQLDDIGLRREQIPELVCRQTRR